MQMDKVTLMANCLYRCGLIHDVTLCENEIRAYLDEHGQGISFAQWNKLLPSDLVTEMLHVSTTLDEKTLPSFINRLWDL